MFFYNFYIRKAFCLQRDYSTNIFEILAAYSKNVKGGYVSHYGRKNI